MKEKGSEPIDDKEWEALLPQGQISDKECEKILLLQEKERNTEDKEWEKLLPQPDRKQRKISEQEFRSDIRTIKNWVQFFGRLYVIGFIIGIIWVIYEAFQR